MRHMVIIEQILDLKSILTIINNLKNPSDHDDFLFDLIFRVFFVIFVINKKFKSTDCDGSIFKISL